MKVKDVRTKIVCSIGPSSRDEAIIEEMARAGMDVARINFSYGTHDEHAEILDSVRRVSERVGRPIAVMMDLPGPKIRVGRIRGGRILLKEGSEVKLTGERILGDSGRIHVSYEGLPDDVREGDPILLSDGTVRMVAERVRAREVVCRVLVGGLVKQGGGVNLPETDLKLPAITEADRDHLKFGMKAGFDMVAVSFVRSARDMRAARELTGGKAFLIAKVEKRRAVERMDEIIGACDGVIVARGDLGAELPIEMVPMVQKEIIAKCNSLAKPVITATQMLESMIDRPYPTRAEVADVANAIIDGSDALMLSGETAIGRYPVEAVKILTKVAREVEAKLDYEGILDAKRRLVGANARDMISYSACQLALRLGISAIVTPTRTGVTARNVSKYRPKARIIALAYSERVVKELVLSWGVHPFTIPGFESLDELVELADRIMIGEGLAGEGEDAVIVAGDPRGPRGTTDMLKIHRIRFRQ